MTNTGHLRLFKGIGGLTISQVAMTTGVFSRCLGELLNVCFAAITRLQDTYNMTPWAIGRPTIDKSESTLWACCALSLYPRFESYAVAVSFS